MEAFGDAGLREGLLERLGVDRAGVAAALVFELALEEAGLDAELLMFGEVTEVFEKLVGELAVALFEGLADVGHRLFGEEKELISS